MPDYEFSDRSGGNANGAGDPQHRINLAQILAMLHVGGPQNRAELTRNSGLNRSTIARLVGEMVKLGLVLETEPRETGVVGRPSPLVRANDGVVAVCVNPDVDAIAIGLVGLGGKILRRVRHKTRRVPSVNEMISVVSKVVQQSLAEVDEECRIVAMGIAVPGIVRVDQGVVEFAPHLGWKDEPVAQLIEARLGFPTFVANDANLGTIAEQLYGTAAGKSDVIYLNGSRSGIGGGVIVDGHPLSGVHGFGAELGHTSVTRGGKDCYCGRRGCLETEVSLSRLLDIMGEASIDPDDLGSLVIASKDRRVRREVNRQLDVLADAISNFISIFNPEMVVLAGFLGELLEVNPARLLDRVMSSSFQQLSADVEVVRAGLRSQHLLIGAAELAFSPILSDPTSLARSNA